MPTVEKPLNPTHGLAPQPAPPTDQVGMAKGVIGPQADTLTPEPQQQGQEQLEAGVIARHNHQIGLERANPSG